MLGKAGHGIDGKMLFKFESTFCKSGQRFLIFQSIISFLISAQKFESKQSENWYSWDSL